MNISEEIKILCVKRNITCAELARKLGKFPQALNKKMQDNSFSISDLENIAAILDFELNVSFVDKKGD